jgi:hypothetical protein
VAVWEARLTTISGPVAEVPPVSGAAPGGAAGDDRGADVQPASATVTAAATAMRALMPG